MTWLPEELEIVNCDYCGSKSFQDFIVRPDGLHIVECNDCRLLFINPRPVKDAIFKLYDQKYFFKADNEPDNIGYQDYLHNQRPRRNYNSLFLHLLASYVPVAGKHLLELGCASGDFCSLTAKIGANTHGIDLSPDIIQLAKKRFPGLRFDAGPLETFSSPEPYDIACAFEVIEHLLSPKLFFLKMRDLLTADGLLLLTTPNCDYARQIGFNNWPVFYGCHEHLYYFGVSEIIDYARSAGFSVLNWYSYDGYPLLDTAAKDQLKMFLSKIKVLKFLQKLKWLLQPGDIPWTVHGDMGHVLFFLKKS